MARSVRLLAGKSSFIVVVLGLLAALVSFSGRAVAAEFEMYKAEGCMCCEGWAEHLRARGHVVNVQVADDIVAVKDRLGVPEELRSCHTAKVEGYIIEGHVPGEDIERLLAEHPDAMGLAAPGMPVGAPGMDFGDAHEPYDVILFRADGTTEVFAHHE